MSGLGLSIEDVADRRVEPFPLSGATIAADFANDRYWGATPASLITFTRSSSKTDLMQTSAPGASYKTYANDVPAIVPGKGLLSEEPRTNIALNAAAPASQTINVTAGTTYTVWVNAAVGGSATVAGGTAAIAALPAGFTVAVAGGLIATHGAWIAFYAQTSGTVALTIAGTVHAVQVEAGVGPTSFIPTLSAAVTRAADSALLTGASLALVTAASGSMVIRSSDTDASGAISGPIRVQNNGQFMRGQWNKVSGASNNNAGTNTIPYAHGIGDTGKARHALIWTAASRRLSANGGSVGFAATKLHQIATTAVQLGRGSSWLNGYVERIDLFPGNLSDAQLRSFTTIGGYDVQQYGDSLTARADLPGQTVPQLLRPLIGKAVLNCGVEGETSTQIRARFLNDAAFGIETIIAAGRNNYAAGATVQADIAAMVAALTTGRYLVLDIPNAAAATEYVGQANYNAIVALNDALAATYGTRFVRYWQAMIDAFDPGDPMEVIDNANRVVPWRFRASLVNGALASAIGANDTSFSLSFSPNVGIIRIGGEYISITARTGNNVTACVRGYAGTAVAHVAGEVAEQRDHTHWSAAGRAFVVQKIAEKRAALGW